MALTIHTQILSETIIDVPEPTAPDGPGVPIYEVMGGTLYTADSDVDASGQTHRVFATGLVQDSNNTWAEYRIVPRHPGPYPREEYARIIPSQKIDTVNITNSGADVLVYMTTHAPGPGPRRLRDELAVIPGVWRSSPQHEAERGGEGAYRGGDVLPQPEGEPVDYQRVEDIVNFVVTRVVGATQTDSLVNKLTAGQGTVRQQFRALVKQAQRELLTESDEDAMRWRYEMFLARRNANAGVWYNILRGEDEPGSTWNRERRDELKQVVREVLNEGGEK